MKGKHAIRAAGRTAGYALLGFAYPSAKKSAALLRGETARTLDNLKVLKDLAIQARDGIRGKRSGADAAGKTFAEMVAGREAGSLSYNGVYFWFLMRKRSALCVMWAFSTLGLLGVLHGQFFGLVSLLVGGGLGLEFAWLAEFRLWQLREKKLSATEGGSLHAFSGEPGMWKRALLPELTFGLSRDGRRYRAWLWVKRACLVGTILGVLVTVDMYFSNLIRLSAYPAIAAGALALGLLAAEMRLATLRRVLQRDTPRFSALRLEIGACHEELRK